MSFGVAQYKSARVGTASPVGILVQLYDAAIRHLKTAEGAIRTRDLALKGVSLSKAHRIVSELQATLDKDKAPDLCDQLERLYDFVLFQVTEANIKNDPSFLPPAVNVMSTLRGAWAEIQTQQDQK